MLNNDNDARAVVGFSVETVVLSCLIQTTSSPNPRPGRWCWRVSPAWGYPEDEVRWTSATSMKSAHSWRAYWNIAWMALACRLAPERD